MVTPPLCVCKLSLILIAVAELNCACEPPPKPKMLNSAISQFWYKFNALSVFERE